MAMVAVVGVDGELARLPARYVGEIKEIATYLGATEEEPIGLDDVRFCLVDKKGVPACNAPPAKVGIVP